MATPDSSDLTRLLDRKEQARAACERLLLEARAARGPDATLTEGETERLRIARATMRDLDDMITETRSEIERANLDSPLMARLRAAQPQQTTARSTTMNDHGSNVYRSRGSASYWRDLMRASLPGMDDDASSMRRLAQHAEEVATSPDYVEYRDLSRVDGSGGYAVPPAWLMSQYIELARPGRAIANLVQRQPLPGGTDSINIPKILTGVSVAVQTADNQPVSQTDLTDTFINAPVRTIAGQESLAIQLIDQSPIAFDDVIFRDLTAAHATQVDLQTIGGTGTNGQLLGILNWPNISTVVPTSVDVKGLYSAIANSIQTIHVTRYLPPEVICMHPRRFGWLLAQLDQQSRPLFVPEAFGAPFNTMGVLTDVDSQQVVGRCQGLPVVTDPNLPTNLGSGTNEDTILVMRASDLVLFEGGLRARVLPEPKASTLGVILQTYEYAAFAIRYPASVVQIVGGLIPPTF